MNTANYDVIVVGLGAMGSAAVYQLAKAGAKVLGIDQYAPPHNLGSSHGDTRITRLAVGEGESYVPLVQRSHELWRQIEQESGQELLVQCGGLLLSPAGLGVHGADGFIDATLAIAHRHKIASQKLDTAEIASKYPQFNLLGNESGYYEPSAGYLRPERCIQAQLRLAENRRAEIKTNETMVSFAERDSSVIVTTDKSIYRAEKLILTTGPWMKKFLPTELQILKTYRQVVYWFDFESAEAYERYKDFPVFVWIRNNDDVLFGFPPIDGPSGGMKVATEYYGNESTPDDMRRDVSPAEIQNFYEKYIENNLKGLSERCLRAEACLYTVTPDRGFIIDHLPGSSNAIVASPCSGHGFKHSAAIGEVLAQTVSTDSSTTDISAFSFSRFTQ